MFQNPFSFDGRIRRTEYGISYIIYVIASSIISVANERGNGGAASLLFILYIPLLWFFFAQGTKRCHDRGNSAWYQFIPFYIFWMLFADGDSGYNEYGADPKNRLGGTDGSMDSLIDQIGQKDDKPNYGNDNAGEQKVDYNDWK